MIHLIIPKERGGYGIDSWTWVADVVSEVGRACGASGWMLRSPHPSPLGARHVSRRGAGRRPAGPRRWHWCEANGVGYIFGFGGNDVLAGMVRPLRRHVAQEPAPAKAEGEARIAMHAPITSCPGHAPTIAQFPREALEARFWRAQRQLIALEVAAEAMRAHQEERNRIKRDRRLSGDQDRRALEKAERPIEEIVTAIENGAYSRALGDRLIALESERDAVRERLGQAQQDLPDLHPNVAEHYGRKIERLITALVSLDRTPDAGAAIRSLVERVTRDAPPRCKIRQFRGTFSVPI